MKKILAILLILSMTVALAACGGPSDDEIKTIRNVSFEDRELTVTLGANKSTGYEWNYEIYGECIEPSVGRSFKLTGTKGEATGEEITGFEGMSEGTAVIVFTTPTGWDGTGAGDGYTVNVVVAADGTIEKANGMDGAFPGETTPEPTPEPKTSIAIEEIREGSYTGTLPGIEYTTGEGHIFITLSPADITVTIENGQITLYCEAIANAYGTLQDEKTPPAPEFFRTVSGLLPLQQSGDTVIAEGQVPDVGKGITLNHTDGAFAGWEIKEREEGDTFTCAVHIAMENGVPVANITVGTNSKRTTTVPLALASDTADTGVVDTVSEEPLSASYAEMLKSGDYQYTYYLEYEGKPYTATIATYNGMICRKVVSDDGSFSQRVVTIDGHAWKIDDLTGAVVDGGTENAETQPDYSTLTFVASGTLETGAIGDAYDFEVEGEKCNMVFLFAPEGNLVALIVTVGDQTSSMEILNFSTVGNDRTLFDAPQ